MKKSGIFALICSLILLSCIFYSCGNYYSGTGTTTTTSGESSFENKIKELENKILEIQQDKYISEAESKAKITALQNQLEQLKNSLGSTSSTSGTTAAVGFSYTLKDGKAMITGYSGNEKKLVIPLQIDNHPVQGIADDAFRNRDFETVTISDGIKEIGWFSFADSPLIKQITIPPSVESIGYGAFTGHGKTFTVLCSANSFAKNYAASFGIGYTII